jgi:hypothetical protein
MLLFLDTEFTGLDQTRPDPISIGLVDENGREFYAELRESCWTVQCNEWVHFNVLPHLWGGDYVQDEKLIGNRLKDWIESVDEEAVIVTDWPQGDFFIQLKRLLPEWPKNLNSWPIQFDCWSINDEHQQALRKLVDEYHSPERPRHHALHDAHLLRLKLLYAVKNGWRPSFGGDAVAAALNRAPKSSA